MSERDRTDWTAALGRIPSGLFVVTARKDEQETGMLASWIQQCSFEPPQVTIAVQRDRFLIDWLTPGATFVVNVLDDSQTDMIIHFGRGFDPDADAFANLTIQRSANQNVILREALAFLECRARQSLPAGDHHLIVAEVIDGELLGEGHPMMHVRKNGLHY